MYLYSVHILHMDHGVYGMLKMDFMCLKGAFTPFKKIFTLLCMVSLRFLEKVRRISNFQEHFCDSTMVLTK